MPDGSIAGQYKLSNGPGPDQSPEPELFSRFEKAYQVLLAAKIPGQFELDTANQSIRVTVDFRQREPAREALKEILPFIPRRLRLQVDANSLRRVTPAAPVLGPGDEVIIGHSSLVTGEEKIIVIADDAKIANQHLQVRWDGLNRLEIKDVSGKNDAHIGSVEVGPEWMDFEPGAKVRIGDTFLSFQPGDPVG